MTKKHFELIAKAIRESRADQYYEGYHEAEIQRVATANSIADALRDVNPKFNVDKFLEACDV